MPRTSEALRNLFLILAFLGAAGLITIWSLRRRLPSPGVVSRW